jgi:hypothetical protein
MHYIGGSEDTLQTCGKPKNVVNQKQNMWYLKIVMW